MEQKPKIEKKTYIRTKYSNQNPKTNISNLKKSKEKQITNKNVKFDITKIPQDTKEEPKKSEEIENGDKNFQKRLIINLI